MKQGKIWGITEALFNKNNVEMHRIQIKTNGYCSKHKHTHKYNMFYVEEGQLEVHIDKNDYDLTDITVLEKGQSTIVKPGEYHKFIANTFVIAYEIYWTELDTNDIQRQNVGGVT